jgi:hypothetical protein
VKLNSQSTHKLKDGIKKKKHSIKLNSQSTYMLLKEGIEKKINYKNWPTKKPELTCKTYDPGNETGIIS